MVEGLPPAFACYAAHPVTLGRSGAQVFRLIAPGEPSLFLKKSGAAKGAELRAEAERLKWLQGKLPVPEVVYFDEGALEAWLVTTAVPGADLTHFNRKSSAVKRQLTVMLARALRQFHALDVRDCSFQHSAAQTLERLSAELSERKASSETRSGLQAVRAKLEVLKQRQPEEDLVMTHGDACLPNVLALAGDLSGFIDFGAAGLGDRCRDLERACWSLDYNYGKGYDKIFLSAYGVTELDRKKLDFYRELEWFSFDQTTA